MIPNPKTTQRVTAALLAAMSLQLTQAQTAPAPAAASDKEEKTLVMEAFVTTGSNIKRLDQEKALPVTVFSMAQLETRDSTTPMDLLIGIPEITNIPANETSTNAVAARGDNANVALRGLDTLNTLILLNGRRMPLHPLTSSAVNVNTLPTYGLQQVEILRDGASAVYGADAVAGVVNYVTQKKPNGSQIQQRFGMTQHGGGMDYQLNIGYGKTFANGKGSVVFSYTGYHRDAIYLREREVSAQWNRLAKARAPWNVIGQTAYDGTSSIGKWAQFIPGVSTSNTATRFLFPVSGVATDTPTINSVALARRNPTTGALNQENIFENYNDYVTGQPRSWRNNIYNRVEYDLTPDIRAFMEGSVYFSRSYTGRQPITLNSSDSRVFLGVDNPYNPFGSRFFNATGAPNSDGSARLVGAPQQTTMVAVFLTDGGPEKLEAVDGMYRFLGGVGGKVGKSSWNWEAAVMAGGVYATDQAKNAIRDSYLRGAALRNDATAWNPFGYTFKVANGAVVADQKYTNPDSVRGYYTRSANRFGHSKLATVDLSMNGTVMNTWAGPLAASVGLQWRYDFNEEHKDAFVNANPAGSIGGDGQPLDPTNNDILVTSPKFDYSNARVIGSAFAEAVVPLAAPKNNIPLAQSVNFNTSVRYEHYSDFGGTTRPKIGGDWRPSSWLLVRASVNKGFRAPILSQLYQPAAFSVASPPGVRDISRNNFLTAAGLAADLQFLTKTYTLANVGLKPELTDGRTVGIAVDIPKIKGLSFAVDYWEINQKNLIVTQTTTAGLDESMLKAYTQAQLAAGKSITAIDVGSRLTPFEAGNYQGDPFWLRNPVNAADIALFQQAYARLPQNQWVAPLGTPVGGISQLINSTGRNFTNGLDFSVSYNLPKTSLGQIRASTEWSTFFNKYTKTSPNNPMNDEVIQMLVPKWKSTATIQWRKGGWDASINAAYQSDLRTGATATAAQYAAVGNPGYIKPVTVFNSIGIGTVNYYEKGDSTLQLNGGISYRFSAEAPKWIRRTQIRVGVNNIMDEDPPHASMNSTGYSGGSGSSLWVGRAFSFSTTRDF